MSESQRIASLFKKLYDGTPWLHVNIVSTLKTISANQAHKKVLKNCNSIWEITEHLIAWRLNVLQRVQGNIIKTPDHNYIKEIEDSSDIAWTNTLESLETSQIEWINFLSTQTDKNLECIYSPNDMTFYEHIHGIIQHDAYHLGQIVLLAKQFKN